MPFARLTFLAIVLATTPTFTGASDAERSKDAAPLPDGWQALSPRDEIRPTFSFEPKGGPNGAGAFVITTSDSVGDQGWIQKTFPVTGGAFHRFSAVRKAEDIAVPRRSVLARIVWQDTHGKAVRADVPAGHENEPGAVPLAEPEHLLDGPTDGQGWTTVAGTYRAPSQATQAVVELHLQWAPLGRVAWAAIHFTKTTPPPPRKIRLATVHYRPSGKSPRTNCEEYAPLLAEAAHQKADLVVLGETVHYVGVHKKPHEVAEPIPGPASDYFGQLAKEHRLHIVVSLYERLGKLVYNTAILVGPDGRLIGKYRKVCLPHSEVEAGVTPGDAYPVFDTALGKIGMMVCYDGFFPEVARELTSHGAEVIAWPVWGCNPLLGRARACENHVYVVSSTYTDAKSDWMISAVFDHAGRAIAQADKWGTVAVAEVDLSQRHFWRNNLGDFHAMAQRHRPERPVATTAATAPNWRAELQKPFAKLTIPASLGIKPVAVRDRADWEKQRAGLVARWQEHLGKAPDRPKDLDVRIEKTETLDDHTRILVSFHSEGSDRVRAYLLLPKDLKPGEKRPAMVVLHQTTKETLREPVGLGSRPDLAIALHLTRRGYVTLSPECYIMKADGPGARAKALAERVPGWTGLGKMAFDASRCVDLLVARPEVDAARIGCIGHSLGAKETLYAVAFEPRFALGIFSEGGIGLRMSNWTAPWYLGDRMKQHLPASENHQVLALVAPRPFLILGGESADGDASWPFIQSVLPVYETLGAGDRIGLINHRQKHSFPEDARAIAYRWLDHWMKHTAADFSPGR